jgi:hypothetical protein
MAATTNPAAIAITSGRLPFAKLSSSRMARFSSQ